MSSLKGAEVQVESPSLFEILLFCRKWRLFCGQLLAACRCKVTWESFSLYYCRWYCFLFVVLDTKKSAHLWIRHVTYLYECVCVFVFVCVCVSVCERERERNRERERERASMSVFM